LKEREKEIKIQKRIKKRKKYGPQKPRIRRHKGKGGVVERKGKRNKDTKYMQQPKEIRVPKSKDRKRKA